MPRIDATASTVRTAPTGRSTRRRTLRIAAAGLTAVAALTLTACSSEDDALKTAPAKPFHPAPQIAAEAELTAAGHDVITTRADGFAAAGDGGENRGRRVASVRHPACDAAKVRIAAKPLNRPVNHVLLEATNTTGATCDLYGYPYLRVDDSQSPLADLAESRPQAVVTLAPGESGYAAVMTSAADGSGANGRTTTSLTVSLRGRDGKGSIGGSAAVALAGDSTYVDDSAWVTYWQTNPSDAANW
ncbi:DUF4232 domain-containing protein [Streptomyces piniterrae]|uniref:DUF4232 domain-containing protein n=1 Tax=Streptomyces piniterrae TaxID=2571125 RepID=A0A4V5MK03_9ACTN|nr:DUF4232 domain-containing protein [Streptomyces piniterrae]TJZ50118.1 DUF4232 domain-containing protein [Streptomyces piniterrae]